jgi:hypothetical protein
MANAIVISSAAPPFDPWKHSTTLLLHHSAALDSFRTHRLVDDPEEADIILFGEMSECGAFAERVRAHPWYRRYPEKCFLFDSSDSAFPVLPGIYASLTRRDYRADHTRTGFYLYVVENPFVQWRPLTGAEPYLASFIGSSLTHPVRKTILSLQRPDFFLQDTENKNFRISHVRFEPWEREVFWSEYADAMASARFSLCPRGHGTGTIRLFESMKMGRACVILADDWPPNEGVDWESFSLRIPESQASRIPEILNEYKERAAEMGARARAEWEKWFSEKVRFHRVVELCLDIQRQRTHAGLWRRVYDLRYIPLHPHRYLRSKKWLYQHNNGRIYW